MCMQTDQAQEHVAVDAADPEKTRTITIEPDRHGMTIRFEGSDKMLVIDLSKGKFDIHSFEDDYQELLTTVG